MRADIILHGGDIRTMNDSRPNPEAVAIAGPYVVAVGSNAEIQALSSPETRNVDLRGQTVIPGCQDCHMHLLSYALTFEQVDLVGTKSLAEALDRIAARVETLPPGQALVGRGWDETLWEKPVRPTREDLDRVTAGRLAQFRRKCGHMSWVNSAALEGSDITENTPDPPGGMIERDAKGRPTGILVDRASGLVNGLGDGLSDGAAADMIREAIPRLHEKGLVGVHALEGAQTFRALQRLRADGALSLRVQMAIPAGNLDAAAHLGLQAGLGDEWLRICCTKAFADGSLGAQSAYMLEAYEDKPDDCGICIIGPDGLLEVIRKAEKVGIPAAVHAIGDRACREVLDAIEAARRESSRAGLRHRIEHVQLLHPDDIPRLAKLGVVASMQPLHATQDSLMAHRHWGARCAGAYAFRSVLATGAVLAFGSDAPVEDPSVMKGIHAAVTRRRPDGSPGPEGWYPAERLTVEQAVHAYTVGAAFAAGQEAISGSIAAGKLADLHVLSRNIFEIDPMEILETEVSATMIGGHFVHGDEAFD